MSHRPHLRVYLRYFKARLWNLARPGFWGTAIFLSVVGLFIKENWTNREFLIFRQEAQVASPQAADSSVSAEDKAIAADIDNLPVIRYDFKHADVTSTVSTLKSNTQAKNNKDKLEDLSKQQTAISNAYSNPGLKQINPVPVQNMENPFIGQAEKLLQMQNFQSYNTSAQSVTKETSVGAGMEFTPQISSSQSTVPVNALQTALNQQINQNLPIGNGTNLTQTNSFERSLPTNSLPSPSFLPSVGLTTQANIPVNQTTNQAPVTPAAPSNITPYYSQTPNPNEQQLTQPIAIPGQYTGESQINASSYP